MSFAYSSDDAIRLTTLQTNLLEVEKEAQKVRGKKVILVIGPTGSGKSTAINYLQGRKMEEVINTASDSYFIKVSEDDSIGTTIPSPRMALVLVQKQNSRHCILAVKNICYVTQLDF